MKKIFGSSWRTSLTGYIEAIFLVVLPIILSGTFQIKRDWPLVVVAAFRAIKGRLSKDSDGITKKESMIVAKEATGGAIPPTE